MNTIARVKVILVWPVRPNLVELSCSVVIDGRTFDIELTFPSIYTLTESISLVGTNWCQVSVTWAQPFEGSLDEMTVWARSPVNAFKLIEHAERAQNVLVDVAKDRSPANFDLRCIRHFGPIEWPLYSVRIGPTLVFQQIGSATGAQFRSLQSEMVPAGCTYTPVSFERRTWMRAHDLALSGYQTEGALLAAAVLDSVVQRFLCCAMERKGLEVNSASELLRNTTTKRLLTYLDSVLKLATGRSLREDNASLFGRLKRFNKNRNDAIHNGKELTRTEALESVAVCGEILSYLHEIDALVVDVPQWPADSIWKR